MWLLILGCGVLLGGAARGVGDVPINVHVAQKVGEMLFETRVALITNSASRRPTSQLTPPWFPRDNFFPRCV